MLSWPSLSWEPMLSCEGWIACKASIDPSIPAKLLMGSSIIVTVTHGNANFVSLSLKVKSLALDSFHGLLYQGCRESGGVCAAAELGVTGESGGGRWPGR